MSCDVSNFIIFSVTEVLWSDGTRVPDAELENKPIKLKKKPILPKLSQTEFNFCC